MASVSTHFEPHDEPSSRPRHRLSGVRLGKVERWLLINASSPDRHFGLVLDARGQSRSAQEAVLRGARKLARVGLLEVERVATWISVRDPRRLEPKYRDGAFYRWDDPTRSRLVWRLAVWLSQFGFQVSIRYRTELMEGRPIRWDPEEVRHVEKVAAARWVDHRRSRLIALEQRRREEEAQLNQSDPEPTLPVVPPFVVAEEDHRRWRAAVARAAKNNPRARSRRLWEASEAIYRSADATDALTPPTSTTATDQFLKKPVSLLR
jgi:hypothetical protein